MDKRFVLGITICSLAPALLHGESGVHVVRKDEVLSEIAARYLGRPVWPRENGALARLLRLNPGIHDPNKVRTGQKVRLEEQPGGRRIAGATAEPSAVSPAPAPPATENAYDPESRLTVEAGAEYFRIDATDRATGASSTVLSGASPLLAARWRLDWNEAWASQLEFRFRKDRLQPLETGPKTLRSAAGAYGFSGEIERKWGTRSRSGAGLEMRERPYLRALSGQVLTVDEVGVPAISLRHEVTFLRAKTASAGVGLRSALLLPAKGPGYDTKPGWEGTGYAYFSHERDAGAALRGTLFYGHSRADSSITKARVSSLGAFVSLTWRLP